MVYICSVGHIAWASALLNLTTVGNARASTSGMSNWVQTLTLFLCLFDSYKSAFPIVRFIDLLLDSVQDDGHSN